MRNKNANLISTGKVTFQRGKTIYSIQNKTVKPLIEKKILTIDPIKIKKPTIKNTKPKITKPKITKPKTTKPKITKPKTTKPKTKKITQPKIKTITKKPTSELKRLTYKYLTTGVASNKEIAKIQFTVPRDPQKLIEKFKNDVLNWQYRSDNSKDGRGYANRKMGEDYANLLRSLDIKKVFTEEKIGGKYHLKTILKNQKGQLPQQVPTKKSSTLNILQSSINFDLIEPTAKNQKLIEQFYKSQPYLDDQTRAMYRAVTQFNDPRISMVKDIISKNAVMSAIWSNVQNYDSETKNIVRHNAAKIYENIDKVEVTKFLQDIEKNGYTKKRIINRLNKYFNI